MKMSLHFLPDVCDDLRRLTRSAAGDDALVEVRCLVLNEPP